MALRVASAKRWPCPSRSMETPASGPSLSASIPATVPASVVRTLRFCGARLGERDVGGPDDHARLAADRAGAAGEPDRAGRVRDLGEVVSGVDRGKPAGDHRRPGEAAQPGAAQAGSKDVFDRPCRHHMTVVQHHDARGEPRHLLDGMRHVHDGDAQIVAERLDQRQDFELALGVERGEGLVHQQNLGRGEQRPAHGHALLFAPRKARRLALEQVPDPQRLDHLGERNACCRLRRKPTPEQEILPDAEMREELASWNTSPTRRR